MQLVHQEEEQKEAYHLLEEREGKQGRRGKTEKVSCIPYSHRLSPHVGLVNDLSRPLAKYTLRYLVSFLQHLCSTFP